MWAISLYAFVRGSWAERLAAGGTIVASYLTLFLMLLRPAGTRYRSIEIPVVIVDSVLLALLLVIAMRSRKFWPLWATAIAGVTVLSHFSVELGVAPAVYQSATSLWSYPLLISLALGVREQLRRRRVQGRT